MRLLLGFCFVLVACGGKLADDTSFDAGDAGDATAKPDAPPIVTVDAAPDVAPGQCLLGPNVQYGTSDCGGDEVDWFATPYDPPADITVDRIEAHMAQGNVALLASTGGGTPGAPLFVGSVGSSPSPTWLGVDVSPPVVLHGGQSYFIGFQGGCSFAANGAEPVEYMAPSVNGPWHDQGVDNWTARLIGTCN